MFRDQVQQQQEKIERAVAEITRAAEAEAPSHREALRTVQERFEDFAAGGLHLEAVGLMWLIVGTLASSLPDEIVWLWSVAW